MTSQAVRALIVVAGPGIRRDAFRALLASLVFVLCASVHHVARAQAADPSSHAGFAARAGSDCEVGAPTPQHLLCEQRNDAPPMGELATTELEDTEEDALLDVPAVGHALLRAPIQRAAPVVPRLASAAWTAQFLKSSGLPRGPPYASH